MKQQRSEHEPPPPASIRLEFSNLPLESRRKLDELLRTWAGWHAAKYLPGYVPPEVVSGSLAYRPDTMYLGGSSGGLAGGNGSMAGSSDGALAGGGVNGNGAAQACIVWEDKPAAPEKAGSEIMWFNVAYEKAGDVPRYNRATDLLLHYSSRKRPADTLLAAEAAAAEAAGRPVKRLRATNRCFNCASYGHTMRECWKEFNQEQVEESRREREASGAGPRTAARRYYLPGAGEARGSGGSVEQFEGEFAGIEAGQLSPELRQALGIGPLAPPPWLQRMRELGLPPAYMAPTTAAPNAAPSDGGAAGSTPPRSPAANGGKAGGSSSSGGAAAATGGNSSASDGVEATAAGTASIVGAVQEIAAAAPADISGGDPLEDFIPMPGSPTAADEEPAGQEGGAQEAGRARDAAPERLECKVAFPGVNAPVPEGADEAAWVAPPQPATVQQRAAAAAAAAVAGLPPGFGAHATPPAAVRGQQPPGSVDRLGSGSGSGVGLRWQPLRGLHPPRAASEGAPDDTPQPHWQHQRQQLQTHENVPHASRMHHGASAPALLSTIPQQNQQQPSPLPQLPPGLNHHSQHQYPQHFPVGQQKQLLPQLPPGFGHQQQTHQQHYQQQQQQPPEDVYSVSTSDAGHLLVYDQRSAGQHPQAHPAQQHAASHWQMHQAQQLYCASQGGSYSGQQPQQQAAAEAYAPPPAPPPQEQSLQGSFAAAGPGSGGTPGWQNLGGWYGNVRY